MRAEPRLVRFRRYQPAGETQPHVPRPVHKRDSRGQSSAPRPQKWTDLSRSSQARVRNRPASSVVESRQHREEFRASPQVDRIPRVHSRHENRTPALTPSRLPAHAHSSRPQLGLTYLQAARRPVGSVPTGSHLDLDSRDSLMSEPEMKTRSPLPAITTPIICRSASSSSIALSIASHVAVLRAFALSSRSTSMTPIRS